MTAPVYHTRETYRLKGRKIPAWQREVYKTVGGAPHPDQAYTVFGEVVRGMDVVDSIAASPTTYGVFIVYLSQKKVTMNFPDNLRYTKDHEWIRLEKNNEAVIGITDFAQKELGDIVYVEVETIGKALAAETVFGTVEAVKTVSDLYLPVAGTILEVNPELTSAPDLVNSDPYGKGWMVRMTVKDAADVDKLMDAAAYGNIVH